MTVEQLQDAYYSGKTINGYSVVSMETRSAVTVDDRQDKRNGNVVQRYDKAHDVVIIFHLKK